MRPFVLLNGALARGLARLFGVRAGEEPEEATEEEIRMMVDVGSEKGSIEQSEKDMINKMCIRDRHLVALSAFRAPAFHVIRSGCQKFFGSLIQSVSELIS